MLDITDMTQDYVAEVDIRPYLPEGVFLANAEEATQTVTVRIQGEASRRMEIPEERIRLVNIPEGYRASFPTPGARKAALISMW